MNSNPDTYYDRPEVSNSDLTALKELLHPRLQFGNREEAFRFGSLVDAIITEPARVNYYRLTVDDVQYTEEEFRHAREMYKALRMEARDDGFLDYVLRNAGTQRFMDVAGSDHDFIYAISKKNCKVFRKQITRGDAVYNAGREKYEELAFQYWCLNLV